MPRFTLTVGSNKSYRNLTPIQFHGHIEKLSRQNELHKATAKDSNGTTILTNGKWT